MSFCRYIVLMAEYNEWMNDKLYAAAARLPPEALAQDRGAYFGSILGTLNHLVAADTIWLQRFAQHPARPAVLAAVSDWPQPVSLDHRLFEDFSALRGHRQRIDRTIRRWAASLVENDLEQTLHYANFRGVVARRRLSSLALHFFNHQTHHRGQATTLLTQAGQDVGVTDLVTLIPNELDG